jgi:hypothetical protein
MNETEKVLRHLISRCGDEQRHLAEVLAQGLAKDHADYRFQCGVMRGISVVQGYLADMLERMSDDDE